jgi:hypothetical protein
MMVVAAIRKFEQKGESMQLKKQSSAEESWFVLTERVGRLAMFAEPSAPANDRVFVGPLETEQGGLLRALKSAVSWLMAETVFGFAAYGAAAHPYVLAPTSSLYEDYSAERGA